MKPQQHEKKEEDPIQWFSLFKFKRIIIFVSLFLWAFVCVCVCSYLVHCWWFFHIYQCTFYFYASCLDFLSPISFQSQTFYSFVSSHISIDGYDIYEYWVLEKMYTDSILLAVHQKRNEWWRKCLRGKPYHGIIIETALSQWKRKRKRMKMASLWIANKNAYHKRIDIECIY